MIFPSFIKLAFIFESSIYIHLGAVSLYIEQEDSEVCGFAITLPTGFKSPGTQAHLKRYLPKRSIRHRGVAFHVVMRVMIGNVLPMNFSEFTWNPQIQGAPEN